MPEITTMTLTALKLALEQGELSSREIVRTYIDSYTADQAADLPVNGFIEIFSDALTAADAADARRAAGKAGPLEGLPLAIKDNILVAGKPATCASGILKGFTAPYSATVVRRLQQAGAIPLGRTNMDEFGMGSSCEYSIYGATRNPLDRERIPGGSSGGSAAVVAAGQAPCALGTETGGSIRLPAAFCGLYGLKPSYGALSRYGVVAFGSSLDQIGILARSPEDIALVFRTGAGLDGHDETSAATDYSRIFPLAKKSLKGLKIAVPQQFTGQGIDPAIMVKMEQLQAWFNAGGATINSVSLPILESTVALYYILAPAEASSNLARYDGIRYGFRAEDIINLKSLYVNSRSQGFGKEVKRRIFIGNYVLSSGYYDAYYKKAMEVRSLLKNAVAATFKDYDLLLAPTSPCLAFKIGEKADDPLAMYMTDICTTFANLALIPSLSMPCGNSPEGLPVGLQIAGPRFSEELLLQIAQAWDQDGGAK